MNLENRDKIPGYEESYLPDDFDLGDAPEAEKKPDVREDKMHRILEELADLKTNVASTTAPAASRTDSYGSGDAILSELTRLREENIRAQTSQEINAQLTRMKEELARELSLRGTSAPHSSDNASLILELRRINERIDSMERKDTRLPESYSAMPVPPPVYAPPTSSEPLAMLKTLDDINSKLLHLDTQVSELSVMTIANDVTPVAKDVLSVKDAVAALDQKLAARPADESLEMTDRVLDELVRLQTAVEDIKAAVDRMEAPVEEPFEEEEQAVQGTLFETRQTETLEQIKSDLSEGLRDLNEQIAALHADLKIYGEEDSYRANEDAAANAELSINADEAMLNKLNAIEESLTALAGQAARENGSEILDQLGDLRAELVLQNGQETLLEQIKASVEALRERSEMPDEKPNSEQNAELADRVDVKLEEIRQEVETITPQLAYILSSVKDYISEFRGEAKSEEPYEKMVLDALAEVRYRLDRLNEAADRVETPEDPQADTLREIRESIERLAGNIRPVDLSPVVNTIAAMKSDVDFSPIERGLDALREQLALTVPSEGTPVDLMPVLDAVEELKGIVLTARSDDATASFHAKTAVDLTPILSSIDEMRREIGAIRVSEPSVGAYEALIEEFKSVENELAALRTVVPAARESTDRIDSVLAAIDAVRAETLRTADGLREEWTALRSELCDSASKNAGAVDLSPVLDAVDALRKDVSGKTSAPAVSETVDLIPVLDAVEALRNDFAEKISTPAGAESGDASSVLGAVAALRADVLSREAVDLGPVADAIDSVRAKLDRLMGSAPESGPASELRAELASIKEKVNRLLLKETPDQTELLNAIERSGAQTQILAELRALREETAAVADLKREFETYRRAREQDEALLRRIVREELAGMNAARPVTVVVSPKDEITATADAAVVKPAAKKPRAASAKKPAAKSASSAAKKTTAKPAAKKPAAKASSVASAKRASASASSGTSAKRAAAPASSSAVKIPKFNPSKRPVVSSKSGPLSTPDMIARQIASKLALEQMILDAHVSKARAQKVLTKVRERAIDGKTFEPTPESIKQHANQIVIDRMVERVRTQEEE